MLKNKEEKLEKECNLEKVKKEGLKKEVVKKEEVKEGVKKEGVKEEGVKKEEVKEGVKEEVKKEGVKKGVKKEVNVINSIKENYISHLCILISIYLISSENYFLGLITFIIITFISYNSHYESHKSKNIFTILHHYHHEHDNFLSHISQVLLELTSVGVFLPLYYIFGRNILNPWILLFFIIFYSTIHNINYSILKVNDVHKLHHESTKTNIGPDILDITFGTKNKQEISVENTNHYIPNIIITTIIVLLTKELYKNDYYKDKLLFSLKLFLSFSFIFLTIISIYLWIEYKK